MYKAFAQRLVRLAVASGAIGQEEEELYLFAYESLIAAVVGWASLLLLSAVFHAFWGAVLFMLFYIPLRGYAGGYHEGTYLRCYLLSVVSFVALIWLCPYLAAYLPVWVVPAAGLLSAAVVFWRAPVADPNKPLDEDEYAKYRRQARMLASLELAALCAGAIFGVPQKLLVFACAGPVIAAWLLLCPKRRQEEA